MRLKYRLKAERPTPADAGDPKIPPYRPVANAGLRPRRFDS